MLAVVVVDAMCPTVMYVFGVGVIVGIANMCVDDDVLCYGCVRSC